METRNMRKRRLASPLPFVEDEEDEEDLTVDAGDPDIFRGRAEVDFDALYVLFLRAYYVVKVFVICFLGFCVVRAPNMDFLSTAVTLNAALYYYLFFVEPRLFDEADLFFINL